MDDFTFSGETSMALDTPAAVAARDEYAKVLNDPKHPHHDGLKRNAKEANAYVDGLYKKAFPQTTAPSTPTAPAPLRELEQENTLTPEDRVAQTEVEEMLRQSFGDSYDSEMHNMRIGVSHLRSINGGDKALGEFASLISGLGPLAELKGIRFLSEIGQLIKQQGGRT